MTTKQKIGYRMSGFVLSLLTASVMTVALQVVVNLIWTPLPGLLLTYTTRLVIVVMAVASTIVSLLCWLENEELKRGVWCFMYALTAISVIGLALSLFR